MASQAGLRRSTRRVHAPHGDGSAGGEALPWHFVPGASGDGRVGGLQPGSPVTRDNAVLGLLVIRGVDWKWEDQDGGVGLVGSIIALRGTSTTDQWVRVCWPSGASNAYRCGHRDKFDLLVAPSTALASGSVVSPALARPGLRVWPGYGAAGREALTAAGGPHNGGTVTSVVELDVPGQEAGDEAAPRHEPSGRRRARAPASGPGTHGPSDSGATPGAAAGNEPDICCAVTVKWDAARHEETHTYALSSRSFPLLTEPPASSLAAAATTTLVPGAAAPRGRGSAVAAHPVVKVSDVVPGLRVIRGPNWCGGAQDGGPGGEGYIVPWATGGTLGTTPRGGWVFVHWQSSGATTVHRVGAHGCHDLAHVTPTRPRRPSSRAQLAAAATATARVPQQARARDEAAAAFEEEAPLQVGDIVTVSPNYQDWRDAAHGPLRPGGTLGRVLRDDHSSLPLHVLRLDTVGGPWWYCRQALRRAPAQDAMLQVAEETRRGGSMAAALEATAGGAGVPAGMDAPPGVRRMGVTPTPWGPPRYVRQAVPMQPVPAASSDEDGAAPQGSRRRATTGSGSIPGLLYSDSGEPEEEEEEDDEGGPAPAFVFGFGDMAPGGMGAHRRPQTAGGPRAMASLPPAGGRGLHSQNPGSAPGVDSDTVTAYDRALLLEAQARALAAQARALGRRMPGEPPQGGQAAAALAADEEVADMQLDAAPGRGQRARVTRSQSRGRGEDHRGGRGARRDTRPSTDAASGGLAGEAAPTAGDAQAAAGTPLDVVFASDRMARLRASVSTFLGGTAPGGGPGALTDPLADGLLPTYPMAAARRGAIVQAPAAGGGASATSAELAAAQADVGAPVTTSTALVGLRVCRGIDWRWAEQDGGPGGMGTIRRSTLPGNPHWCTVAWDAGGRFSYRTGAQQAYDLCIAPGDVSGAPTLAPGGAAAPPPAHGAGAGVPGGAARMSAAATMAELNAHVDALASGLVAFESTLASAARQGMGGPPRGWFRALVPPGTATPHGVALPPSGAPPPLRFAVGARVVLAPHAIHHGAAMGVLAPGQLGTVVEVDTSGTPNCVTTSAGERHWYATVALRLASDADIAQAAASAARPAKRAKKDKGPASAATRGQAAAAPPRTTAPVPAPPQAAAADSPAEQAGVAAALAVCAAAGPSAGGAADTCRRLRDAVAAYSDAVYSFQQAEAAHAPGGVPVPQPRRLPVLLQVSRGRVVADAQAVLGPVGHPAWSAPLSVRFQGEGGVDSGGLTREFFSTVGHGLCGLRCLAPTGAEGAFEVYFDPSATSAQDVHDAGFVGALVAKVLLEGGGARGSRHGGQLTLGSLRLALPAFQHLVGAPVTAADLAALDLAMANSLAHVARTPGAHADLGDATFEVVHLNPHDGTATTHPLLPGGSHIPVTEANREHYCRLRAEWALTSGPAHLLAAFLDGFYSLVPRPVLDALRLDAASLRLAVCGSASVDLLGDVRRHTVYGNGYTARSQVVKWLWEVLGEWPEHRRVAFWRFCTGGDGLPPEGAAALAPPFSIRRAPRTVTNPRLPPGPPTAAAIAAFAAAVAQAEAPRADDSDAPPRLPMCHTCFRALDLPEYRSKEELATALLKAIDFGCAGFEFA